MVCKTYSVNIDDEGEGSMQFGIIKERGIDSVVYGVCF